MNWIEIMKDLEHEQLVYLIVHSKSTVLSPYFWIWTIKKVRKLIHKNYQKDNPCRAIFEFQLEAGLRLPYLDLFLEPSFSCAAICIQSNLQSVCEVLGLFGCG